MPYLASRFFTARFVVLDVFFSTKNVQCQNFVANSNLLIQYRYGTALLKVLIAIHAKPSIQHCGKVVTHTNPQGTSTRERRFRTKLFFLRHLCHSHFTYFNFTLQFYSTSRQKNLVPRANKQFLQRTLANSVHSSMRREYVSRKRKADDDKRVCDTEKKEMKYKQKKFADDAKSQHKATLKNNPNVFSAQKSKTKQSISKARTDSKTA